MMNKLILLLFISVVFGCAGKINPPAIGICFTANKQAVKITGFDHAIIQEIGRDSSMQGWQALLPVYRMPADTDLKNYQPTQPGKYLVTDSAVLFTPDTPFVSGQTYFLRHYNFDDGNTITSLIRGHYKPGSLHFTDLIFKQ